MGTTPKKTTHNPEIIMTPSSLLFILVCVGVGLYLVNRVFPIDPKIKTIINVVVVLLALLLVAKFFGVAAALDRMFR